MLSSDVESVVLILTLLCLLLMLDIGVVTCASEIILVSLSAIFKLMFHSLSQFLRTMITILILVREEIDHIMPS